MGIPGSEITPADPVSEAVSRLNSFGKGMIHHPPCPRHDNHLIYIKERPFCLGCFSFYMGTAISIPAIYLLVFALDLDMMTVGSIGAILAMVPTLIQIKLQVKAFKIFSRSILGVGILVWFWALLVMMPYTTQGMILRAVGIVWFFFMVGTVHYLRNRYGKGMHCKDCPEGDFPICSYRLPLIEKMIRELEDKGEQESTAYDFLVNSRKQILEKDVQKIVRK